MTTAPSWTPHTTDFNNANNIKSFLHEDSHQIWGFIIYRCTYDSDDDWTTFIRRFQHHVKQTLDGYDGLDLLPSLDLTIISDPTTLESASTSIVREHFKHWVTTAPGREQGDGVGQGISQRYRYCIMVDEEALESIVEDPDDGFVKLVQRDWEPYMHVPRARETVEDAVEDCTLHDVGWMMVAYQDVMVDIYCHLRGYNDWYTEYRRPPRVAHG